MITLDLGRTLSSVNLDIGGEGTHDRVANITGNLPAVTGQVAVTYHLTTIQGTLADCVGNATMQSVTVVSIAGTIDAPIGQVVCTNYNYTPSTILDIGASPTVLDIGYVPSIDRTLTFNGNIATVGSADLISSIAVDITGHIESTGHAVLIETVTTDITGDVIYAGNGDLIATRIATLDGAINTNGHANLIECYTANIVGNNEVIGQANLIATVSANIIGSIETSGQADLVATITANLDGTIETIGYANLVEPIVVSIAGTIETHITGHAIASYDPNIPSAICHTTQTVWNEQASTTVAIRDVTTQGKPAYVMSSNAWVQSANGTASIPASFKQAGHLDQAQGDTYRAAASALNANSNTWKGAGLLTQDGPTAWNTSNFTSNESITTWTNPPLIPICLAAQWNTSALTTTQYSEEFSDGSLLLDYIGDKWRPALYPPNIHVVKIPPPIPSHNPVYIPSTHLNIGCPLPGTQLNIRVTQCLAIPVVTVPVQKVYIMRNSFSLHRVADNQSIDCLSFSCSLDANSWNWSWSATTSPYQLDRVFADNAAEPIEVLATINNIPLRLMIESLSRDRSFGSTAIKIAGRGRTAWLAGPYSPILSFNNDTDQTANQIAENVLTFNGISIGWAVDWWLDDWLVSSGAWSQYSTYIEALTKIAEAGGGYVQPHDTSQIVTFRPYYPTAPWLWDTVTPDLALPEAVVTVEGITWTSKTIYDSVYVVGSAKGGRLDRIIRTGMGGTNPSPTVQNDLACDPIMTRQRGIRVLSDCGRQAMVTLKLPILTETGIVRPGTFVSYMAGNVERVGIVRSVKVDVAFPEAWQSIEVETNESI